MLRCGADHGGAPRIPALPLPQDGLLRIGRGPLALMSRGGSTAIFLVQGHTIRTQFGPKLKGRSALHLGLPFGMSAAHKTRTSGPIITKANDDAVETLEKLTFLI